MTRVLMEMSILEAAHLTDLVDQFAELIAEDRRRRVRRARWGSNSPARSSRSATRSMRR